MILGSTKAQVDAQLGRPVMASSLLDMQARGERAYGYSQATDDIVVGFFDDTARYMAVVKRRGPLVAFSPVELASILMLNAPPHLWKQETQNIPQPSVSKGSKTSKRSISAPISSVYFSYVEKDTKQIAQIFGWQPGGKPFIFFFLPAWPGQPPILLNEWQIAKSIG